MKMKDSTFRAFLAAAHRSKDLAEIADLLSAHASPEGEASIAKGIPMQHRALFRHLYRAFPVKIYYRGPRRKNSRGVCSYQGQLNCLKEHATSFAVYAR